MTTAASRPPAPSTVSLQGGAPSGRWEGKAHGSAVSIIFVSVDEPGAGPRLHRHPYAETFIVHSGQAEFTVGDQRILAGAGDVLVAPAGVAHRFINVGTDRLVSTNIHAGPEFIQEDLD